MMMGFGLLLFLVFAGLLVLIALGVGKLLLSSDTSLSNIFSGSREKSAREILEERFVNGEITREEFESMRKELDRDI